MKILFIIDPFVIEPLGIGYLSSIVKAHGHSTLLSKYTSFYNVVCDVKDFKPDILAYSVTTGKHFKFIELSKRLKKLFPNTISIFGGAHPTYFPEMIKEDGVDIIIKGEADKTFLKCLEKISNKREEKIVVDIEELTENLDSLPFPDRDFMYRYEQNRNNPIKNVITSLGCPWSCSYCYSSLYRDLYKSTKKRFVRYRSVDNVITECVELKKYPLKMIYFQDDCFGFKLDWLRDFVQKYKEKVSVPFHCQLRIEMIDEERVKLLKDAGCLGVTFAIESGSEYIRKILLNRNYTNEQAIKGAKLLHKYKLKFRTENMCGIPGETFEDMMETFELNKRVGGTYNWVSIFQPFPRIKLGEYAKEIGLWNGSIDYIRESFFEDTILNFDDKYKNVVLNFQRLFPIMVKYRVPTWIFRFLVKFRHNKFFDVLSKKFKYKSYDELYEIA